jgi:hypothetical protein
MTFIRLFIFSLIGLPPLFKLRCDVIGEIQCGLNLEIKMGLGCKKIYIIRRQHKDFSKTAFRIGTIKLCKVLKQN